MRGLAQHCAARGLSLREARGLFMALYAADQIAAHQGNVTAAARAAGVPREGLHRTLMRLDRPLDD